MTSELKIIVGLGKTGISSVRYLAKLGCNLTVVDNRLDPPGLQELQQNFPKIPVYLGNFDQNLLLQADELIISPGVSMSEPAIAKCLKQGIKVTGDIELFTRATATPIVAITGSNGKSTVTSLVGAMVEAAGKKVGVGGNLGVPALDLLKNQADFYVLELSSFQLETTQSLSTQAAVVLNISEDHMDRYPNLATYLATKQRIYKNCQVAIVNRDEYPTYANLNLPPKVIGFCCSKPQNEDFGIDAGYLVHNSKKLLPLDALKIKGLHNAANALAALALGTAVDLPLDAMLLAMRNFPGLPHRCQWIAKINGVDWYNDSKGTNVGATKSAIEGLGNSSNPQNKIVLIAGGVGKGADFSSLTYPVTKYVRTVVLIGKDAPLIAKALANSSKILHASTLAEAVAICAKAALPGDKVLLSPACASLDMFNNFEHRGEVFITEVQQL